MTRKPQRIQYRHLTQFSKMITNVVKDGHHVKTLVCDKLKKPLDEGEVKQITSTISGVRFVKSAGREKYDGRIDRYDGEWKLIDTINVRDEIPITQSIVGCIDECKVIITDMPKRPSYIHVGYKH